MQFRDMPCSTQAGELLDVVKVEAKPDYVLHLEFENGE